MLWITCVLKHTEVMLILQMILFSNAAHEMGKFFSDQKSKAEGKMLKCRSKNLLNSMGKILSLSFFYAEIAQIRNEELYK